jgi:uncharacterized repeat protein (TIGR04138 family)
MEPANFENTVDRIIARDPRYRREAYLFVREGLDYTQKLLVQSGQEGVRHVTGQELLSGIRAYALEGFGPMAMLVLQEWGVTRCEDFGELVFNMIEGGLLAKTETDRHEDFQGGYDFFEAFRRPFFPKTPKDPARLPEPNSNEA